MENKEQSLTIKDIINNNKLKGSLYSTFKCSDCGKKLIAYQVGSLLHIMCPDYCSLHKEAGHDCIKLDLTEIAAILNFNPIL